MSTYDFFVDDTEEVGNPEEIAISPVDNEVVNLHEVIEEAVSEEEQEDSQLVNDVNQLNEIHDVVNTHVESGEPLPPLAVEMLSILMTNVQDRYGIKTIRVRQVLATENFNSDSIESSQVALEGIKDVLSKLKAMIKVTSAKED